MDAAAMITSRLVGDRLIEVERSDYDWVFRFANDMVLRAACPWRILVEGSIVHGDTDHGQQFGLPAPVDGADRSNKLLLNKTIETVAIRDDTGDITISFSGRTALEILNMSSGYEGWQLNGDGGLSVIAAGGGKLVIWNG
jgi:hypothetical protein